MATPYAVPVRRFGETTRRDAWWLQPVAVFLGLSAFLAYSTWAMFQPIAFAEYGPYLSPMFSPLLFGTSPHAWFGGPDVPTWWPSAIPYSAAMLVLWMPGGFRVPRRLLQGVLGRSAGVHRWRAAQEIPGRAVVSARHPEHPSVFFLPRVRAPVRPRPRRLESVMVPGAGWRDGIRYRRRHACACREHRSAERLHVRLPLPSAPGRRFSRYHDRPSRAENRVYLCQRVQPRAHAMGVGQPRRGDVRRRVRAALRDGDMD